ncbi:MAG: hypothetical protein U1E57_02550 [Paenacidovorax caeni]
MGALGGEQRGGGVVQRQLGGAAAVLRAIAARGHAAGAALNEEQGDTAVRLGRHDEGIGLVTGGYYAFW